MPNFTPNLDLIKPLGNENFSVSHANYNADKIDQNFGDVNTQLENIKYMGKYLNERLSSGNSVGIKLIGDSFVAGVGGSGYYNTPPTQPDLIFVDPIDATEYRESNYTNLSFSNLFRNFILNNYPNASFKKWGVGGKSAKWWNARIRQVTTAEDIVIVQLGTNDRWDTANPNAFKTQLTELLSYLKSISNAVIVMSPSPVSVANNNETNMNFSQQEVNKVIHDVCANFGYPLISHYDNVLDYCHKYGVDINDLFYDGIHPNDKGYDLIWRNIQSSLELYDFANFINVDRYNLRVVLKAENNKFLSTSVPADFKMNKITVNTVTYGNTSGFPENTSGILVTDLTQGTAGFIFQEYHVYNFNKVYRRIWSTDNAWGAWELANSAVNISTNDAYNNNSLPTAFPSGKITHTVITTANAAGFPKTRAGVLITDRTSSESTFNFQIYKTNSIQFAYMRFWSGSAWSAWVQIANLTAQETITPVIGEVGAGLTKDVVLTTTQPLSQSNFPKLSIVTALPAGVMYCHFLNPTGNALTLRIHNTTSETVNVGSVVVKFAQLETY